MILAEKIIKLRKQAGWSQEDLAEKMNISRQSVSKWESTNSIPDLNRIIKLAEIFGVSTDFLLKDDIEESEPMTDDLEQGLNKISLEQALSYVEQKMVVSGIVAKGIILCVCSVVPLFFFLAMAETNKLSFTDTSATAFGIVGLLVMVSLGVSQFIKINQYDRNLSVIEKEAFELEYGVHGAISEKLQKFRPTYNIKLSISIFLFIMSFVPVMFSSIFFSGADMTLLLLNVLFLFIAVGIWIISPVSAKYEAYNNILKESAIKSEKSERAKRAEKLAAFYWPLLITIYLGWSLWTMNWGITWILWPVGAVFFIALVGLMEFFNKE